MTMAIDYGDGEDDDDLPSKTGQQSEPLTPTKCPQRTSLLGFDNPDENRNMTVSIITGRVNHFFLKGSREQPKPPPPPSPPRQETGSSTSSTFRPK